MNYCNPPLFANFVNKELPECPFCTAIANWQFSKKTAFFKNNFYYKCSKCGSVLKIQAFGLPTRKRDFEIYINSLAVKELPTGKIFHISALRSIVNVRKEEILNDLIKKSEKDVSNSIKDKKHSYIPPDGFEIKEWDTTVTRVRGPEYYITEDFEIWDEDSVIVKHEPSSEYPELTHVYIDNEIVGSMKKEMAIDFVKKYGEHFCFYGSVVEYEPDESYPKIIIEIEKPILKKRKT